MNQLQNQSIGILRWIEKYTKTDMVYLTKGGFWLLLGHVIQTLSGLALTIAFANLLPKEVYGTYQFVIAGATVLAAFTLTGMPTAVARAVAQGNESALRAGFRAQLLWSSGIVLAGGALAAYYYANDNTTLALSFLIAGALSPFIEGFGLTRAYLAGKQLFREVALLGFSRKLIPVISLLITILFSQNPVLLIFVYFFSNAIASGLLYRMVVQRYRLPTATEPEMIAYSKHLSVLRSISDITGQIDKVLVWVFLGAAPLAAYGLALFPITHVQSLFKLFRSLTFAKITRAPFDTLQQSLPYKVRIFTMFVFGVIALYIFVAPFLFQVLFPAYPESVLMSQLLILSVAAAPRTLYWQALVAHAKKRQIYAISVSQNIVKIILLLVLLPLYGVWGAIGALLLANAYDATVTWVLFQRVKHSS